MALIKSFICFTALLCGLSRPVLGMEQEQIGQFLNLPKELKSYIMCLLADTTNASSSTNLMCAIRGFNKTIIALNHLCRENETSLAADPYISRYIINALYVKFPTWAPEHIAELLHTNGAQEWLANRPRDITLVQAVRTGNLANVQAALQAGADVNTRYGLATPLWVAVCSYNIPMATMLLAADADVNAPMSPGETSLTWPARLEEMGSSAHLGLELVKLLLAHKATVNTADFQSNALHYAVQNKSTHQNQQDIKNKIMELLLTHGAAINARNRQGCTPLAIAAANDDVESVTFLLAHKATTKSALQESVTAGQRAQSKGIPADVIALYSKTAVEWAQFKGASGRVIELLTLASENGK